MNHKITFLFLLFLLFSIFAEGQPMTDERLNLLTTESDAIIEGKIQGVSTYVNDNDGYVYTSYRVQMSRILKGTNVLKANDFIEFSLPGGVNGDLFTYVTHNGYFSDEMEGIFFLKALNNDSEPQFKLLRKRNGTILYGKYKSIFDQDHLSLGIRQLSNIYQKIEKITRIK